MIGRRKICFIRRVIMKVWITKYALTDGIIEAEGKQDRV